MELRQTGVNWHMWVYFNVCFTMGQEARSMVSERKWPKKNVCESHYGTSLWCQDYVCFELVQVPLLFCLRAKVTAFLTPL